MDDESFSGEFTWTLDHLYRGEEEGSFDSDLRAAREKALEFADLFNGKMGNEDPDTGQMVRALGMYESIYETAMKPLLYAELFHAADTQDHRGRRLFQRAGEKWTEILRIVDFFERQVAGLPEGRIQQLADQGVLAECRYYFSKLMRKRLHFLTGEGEDVVRVKAMSGRENLLRLYDEIMGALSFEMDTGGGTVRLNIHQILGLLQAPDRSRRERALRTFCEESARQDTVFVNLLNALVLDYDQEAMLRRYASPMEERHLQNEVHGELIERMMGAVEECYPLARRYFRLKASFMGVGKIRLSDLFAPLEDREIRVGFSEARRLILESVEGVHPLLRTAAGKFFEERRVDAEVRNGKMYGAFCKGPAPSLAPYIFLSYSGSLKDVITLAHEIGHGIHYRLSSVQRYINFKPSPLLAETAATLLEALVIGHLMKDPKFESCRPAVLGCHMDGIILTVFRQNVISRFEESIHRIRRDHLLSGEEICRVWQDESRRLFGEDVEMDPIHDWGWMGVPHIFHRPFYCTGYVFGGLASFRLIQELAKDKRLQEGIIELLSAGCSRSPVDLLEKTGVDVAGEDFGSTAFRYMEELMDRLEGLSRRRPVTCRP